MSDRLIFADMDFLKIRKRNSGRIILLLILIFLAFKGISQVRTPPGWYHEPVPHKKFRFLLSKINLEVTTGYGRTYYAHKGDGMLFYSGAQGVRILPSTAYDPNTGSVSEGMTNWFNDAVASGGWTVGPGDMVVSSDTSRFKYRSKSINIPFNGALFVEFNRFKIGAGVSWEPQIITRFKPTKYEEDMMSWKADPSLVFIKKYYAMLGGDIYRYNNLILSGDFRIGWWRPGKKFNQAIMDRSLMYNLGVGLEYEASEYFRPYIRAGFEFKNYRLAIPVSPSSITHRANQATLNIGVLMRLPELPRCFIKNCSTQINHQHGDREYRSRVHPIWKKQNPNYGENYPVLFKYKRKNRKKLNAY